MYFVLFDGFKCNNKLLNHIIFSGTEVYQPSIILTFNNDTIKIRNIIYPRCSNGSYSMGISYNVPLRMNGIKFNDPTDDLMKICMISK